MCWLVGLFFSPGAASSLLAVDFLCLLYVSFHVSCSPVLTKVRHACAVLVDVGQV